VASVSEGTPRNLGSYVCLTHRLRSLLFFVSSALFVMLYSFENTVLRVAPAFRPLSLEFLLSHHSGDGRILVFLSNKLKLLKQFPPTTRFTKHSSRVEAHPAFASCISVSLDSLSSASLLFSPRFYTPLRCLTRLCLFLVQFSRQFCPALNENSFYGNFVYLPTSTERPFFTLSIQTRPQRSPGT